MHSNIPHISQIASDQIKSEIDRFESVHPCIYTIYDIVENGIQDIRLKELLRGQIINVEEAFVNSQEWTLSRMIKDIRLGVVGSHDSGKSALVHYFLTGNWNWEDSPEGGRFKKLHEVGGSSWLLLIRDEGSLQPTLQNFSQWIDGLLMVFDVNSRQSFQTALDLHQMIGRFRSFSEFPCYLIGINRTSSSMGKNFPRSISEDEIRRAWVDRKMNNYIECSAQIGSGVYHIFNDVCQQIIHQNQRGKREAYPPRNSQYTEFEPDYYGYPIHNSKSFGNCHQRSVSVLPINEAQHPMSRRSQQYPSPLPYINDQYPAHTFRHPAPPYLHKYRHGQEPEIRERLHSTPFGSSVGPPPSRISQPDFPNLIPAYSHNNLTSHHFINGASPYTRSSSSVIGRQTPFLNQPFVKNELFDGQLSNATSSTTLIANNHQLQSSAVTPTGTPVTQRKNRRISNLFKKDQPTPEEKAAKTSAEINMGVGRAIPLKQGQLYKRSNKTLNKEWKKKFVCLYSDGRICYHKSLKDYMEKGSKGKEIYLGLATARVSGRNRPRATNRNSLLPQQTQPPEKENFRPTTSSIHESVASPSTSEALKSSVGAKIDEVDEGLATSGCNSDTDATAAGVLATSTSSSLLIHVGSSEKKKENKKKDKKEKERRRTHKNNEDEDDTEFEIISYDQKRWEFSASSIEERDSWVSLIEQEIEKCLQSQLSLKEMLQGTSKGSTKVAVNILRKMPGNDLCADCSSPNPDWASLNLGTLICIECSGIHRNLGSHISKVRSLDLDDWPSEYLQVMQAIGNNLANRVWESTASEKDRPTEDTPREQKEIWIRMKYEQKQFLQPIASDLPLTRLKMLIDSVLNRDMAGLLTLLPRCSEKDVNCTVSEIDSRTPVHLACSMGATEILQLLIWYNADIQAPDESGRTPLWHAQISGSSECANIITSNAK